MNTVHTAKIIASILKEIIIARKRFFTQFLSCISAVNLLYYTWCHTTCTYLKGTFFDIDLLFIGLVFTAVIVLLTALKYDFILIVLLSSAVGVEGFLVGYQIVQNVFCPYCLIFGAILFLQFFINYDVRKARVLSIVMITSNVIFPLFFHCSTVPSYGFEEGISYSSHSECGIDNNPEGDSKCCITCDRKVPTVQRNINNTRNRYKEALCSAHQLRAREIQSIMLLRKIIHSISAPMVRERIL